VNSHSGARATRGPDVRAEINVTPLVDVCLVLLIIFMVVTPLIDDAVRLPETAAPAQMADREHRLVVIVKSDGAVAVGEREVLAGGLEEALRGEAAPGREVVIKADREVRYDRVRAVMRGLAAAGINRVGLVTRRTGELGPS